MDINEDMRLAVKRGAYFLDQEHPGWARKLDLSSLRLSSACDCVLGQLYGDYDDGRVSLGLKDVVPNSSTNSWAGEPIDLGFFAADASFGGNQWNALTEAWRDEVQSRVQP